MCQFGILNIFHIINSLYIISLGVPRQQFNWSILLAAVLGSQLVLSLMIAWDELGKRSEYASSFTKMKDAFVWFGSISSNKYLGLSVISSILVMYFYLRYYLIPNHICRLNKNIDHRGFRKVGWLILLMHQSSIKFCVLECNGGENVSTIILF